ncbi:MAG: cysteine-rich small domain-containing protein [Anaerovoracaceae bacterium]|jgi:Zn-finger protein
MDNYKFVQNSRCEYFPCHQGLEKKDFNCLFCYCPLYALGRDCGGAFRYDPETGIKDCSDCLLPHRRQQYDRIVRSCGRLIELVREDGTKKSGR